MNIKQSILKNAGLLESESADTTNYKALPAEILYKRGLKGEASFDKIKALEGLKFRGTQKQENAAKLVFLAGKNWKNFPFKEGTKALAHLDETGEYLSELETEWKAFDREIAFKGLMSKNTTHPRNIFNAGTDWKSGFDYIEATKKLCSYPENFGENKKTSRSLAPVSSYIISAGEEWKNFDYDLALNEIIKRDETGRLIAQAGEEWFNKPFDFKKALDSLIKIDKTGEHIYRAVSVWKKVEYNKAKNALEKLGTDNYYYKKVLDKKMDLTTAQLKKIDQNRAHLPRKTKFRH